MRIGMVGLGRMGANMVRRLQRAKHECVVFDVNAAAVTALEQEGFTGATSLEDLVAMAKELFEVVGSGAVKITVNQTYALKDAAQAHRDLEARKTTGSTVLLP